MVMVIGLGFSAETASAADLTVAVEGVRSSAGQLILGLYTDAKQWPEGNAAYSVNVPAVQGRVVYVFKDLPPGRYALSGFDDENGNGEMDYNFFGLPKEGFFFSNDRHPVLSTPSFDACAFDVLRAPVTIVVHIQHWGGG